MSCKLNRVARADHVVRRNRDVGRRREGRRHHREQVVAEGLELRLDGQELHAEGHARKTRVGIQALLRFLSRETGERGRDLVREHEAAGAIEAIGIAGADAGLEFDEAALGLDLLRRERRDLGVRYSRRRRRERKGTGLGHIEDQRVAGAQPWLDLDEGRGRQGLAGGVDRSFLGLQRRRGGGRRRRRRRDRTADAELLQEFLLLLGRQGLERVDLGLGRGLLRRRRQGRQGERDERRPQPGSQVLPKHQNLADHCR